MPYHPHQAAGWLPIRGKEQNGQGSGRLVPATTVLIARRVSSASSHTSPSDRSGDALRGAGWAPAAHTVLDTRSASRPAADGQGNGDELQHHLRPKCVDARNIRSSRRREDY
jgi:hypothetical protein